MKQAFLIILLFLSACAEDTEEGEVVAEVFDAKLYQSDLDALFSSEVSAEDSVFIVREFINSWVNRQVVLHEAQTVLTDKERDKTNQMQEYKNDLISYETLNKLAIERIDTNYTDEELMSYYEANEKEFELSENIIKFVFFRVPADLEDIDDRWNTLRQSDLNLEEFSEWASKHGGSFYTDTASWVYFDDILKEIPINTYNQEHYLNNNKFIRINEGNARYFVKILDFRIKSATSPFEMERERIKKILFVKKQKETLRKIETELVSNAYKQNKVIIH